MAFKLEINNEMPKRRVQLGANTFPLSENYVARDPGT